MLLADDKKNEQDPGNKKNMPENWANGWSTHEELHRYEVLKIKNLPAREVIPQWVQVYARYMDGKQDALPSVFDETCKWGAENIMFEIQRNRPKMAKCDSENERISWRVKMREYGDTLVGELLILWGMMSCWEVMPAALRKETLNTNTEEKNIPDTRKRFMERVYHGLHFISEKNMTLSVGLLIMNEILFPSSLFTAAKWEQLRKCTFKEHFGRTLGTINEYFPSLARRLSEEGLPEMDLANLCYMHGFMRLVEACLACRGDEQKTEDRIKQLIFNLNRARLGEIIDIFAFTRRGIDPFLTREEFKWISEEGTSFTLPDKVRICWESQSLRVQEEINKKINGLYNEILEPAAPIKKISTLGKLVEPVTQKGEQIRLSKAERAAEKAAKKERAELERQEQQKKLEVAAKQHKPGMSKKAKKRAKKEKEEEKAARRRLHQKSNEHGHTDETATNPDVDVQENEQPKDEPDTSQVPLQPPLVVSSHIRKPQPKFIMDPTRNFTPRNGHKQHQTNSGMLITPFSNQLFQIDHTREHINQNHVPHYPLPDFTRISTVNRHIMLVLDSPPDPNHDINLYHVWSLGICRIVRQHNIRLDELVTLCVPALRTHHFELYPVYQLIGEFNILGEIIENITYQTKKHDEQYKNLVIRLPSDVFDKCIAQIFMKLNKNKFTVIFMFMDYIQIGDALTLLPDPFVTWKFGENDIRTPDYEYATFAEMTLEEVHTLRNWYKEQKAAYIRNQSQVDLPYIDKLTIPQLGG